jgi:hypothetical protein
MRKTGPKPSTPRRAETREENITRLRKEAMKKGMARRKASKKGKY